MLVYTTSTLAEQSTPAPAVLTDVISSVSSLAFADLDLDAAELGGAVTWVAAADESQVTGYDVYLSGTQVNEVCQLL